LFSVGDRVVAHRNARDLGLLNRDSGRVAAVDLERRELTFSCDRDGRDRSVPARYLDAGNLDHGYAITGHKAQGQTFDRAHVLGAGGLYREWGYVALSRGREANTFYITAPEHDTSRERSHGPPEPPRDARQDGQRGLERSRAQTAATDLQRDDLTATPTRDLADEQRQLQRALNSYEGQEREVQRLGAERDHARHQAEQATRQRQETERRLALQRRGLRDRDLKRELRSAVERQRGSETRARERAEHLTAKERELQAKVTGRDDSVQRHPREAERHAAISDELDRRERTAARRAELTQPKYLTREIGRPPDQPSQRQAWQDAARAIERYRQRHDITDPQRALGQRPHELEQRREHQQAERVIERAHQTLHRGIDRGIELEL
jgi:hypothetical protein